MSYPVSRHLARGAPLSVLALTLVIFGCNTDRMITGSVPVDLPERHPIRLTEGEHSVQLLIGTGRGDLTAEQRAQVAYMARSWNHEATGVFYLDVPKGTPNARAAKYAARETQSLLRASGVPARAIVTRSYAPPTPESLGPLRLSYARIVAEVGPCGEWPEDLGVSPSTHFGQLPPSWENRPYWNFGCATQQNIAATVANPEDLVQPRAATPPLAARRQTVMEKYRKGENPSGQYETKEAKASDVQE
jgi:pilus assembly protein CpaD